MVTAQYQHKFPPQKIKITVADYNNLKIFL